MCVGGGGGGGGGEEVYYISPVLHAGAQLKSTHNIRLLCGNPLSLCRKRTDGLQSGIMAHPERLQTAMSLYSTKLSCIVLMVDKGIGQPCGMERSKTIGSSGLLSLLPSLRSLLSALPPSPPPPSTEFADICHQSTDLHFPDYSEQLSAVLECAMQASESRDVDSQQLVLESSSSSQTSEGTASTPRGGSPYHCHGKGMPKWPKTIVLTSVRWLCRGCPWVHRQ